MEGAAAGEAGAWCAGAELGGWRLLAALEAATLLLVALALLLHALRTRTARAARLALRGQSVLITKGDSALGRELARQFAAEGCDVRALCGGSGAESAAGARMLRCDTRLPCEVRALAAALPALDVLVVCGAAAAQPVGLHALADAVSEEVYSNFRLLEELAGRMRAGGRVAWVCAPSDGTGGPYAGAARSLQAAASALLHQVAGRTGCRAVWCEARGGTGGAAGVQAAAERVLRRVAQDGTPPRFTDVFRELRHKLSTVLHKSLARCAKLWT